jgi:uncharacterized membrane protein
MTPAWVRPGTYFGVRVPPDYRSTPETRQSRRKFMLEVWLATAISVGLSIVGQGRPQLFLLGVLIQSAAAVVAFRSGWQKAEQYRIEPPSIRTAHLFAERPRVPGGFAAVMAPFLLPAAMAVYLILTWDSIPLRFPIHWDMQGRPNGWSDRSFRGVFGPLLIAFATMIALLGLLLIQKYQTRRAPSGSGPYRRTRAALTVYVVVMWMMAIIFSLMALMAVVTGAGGSRVAGAFAVIVVLTVLAGMSIGGWLWTRASAEPDDTPADTTPDECWKWWGQIYYNPNDPTIMVEKRIGIGYTFNFARWQGWLILGVFFAVTVGIILFVHH